MPFIGGDHDAIVRRGGRGDHHVERASGPTRVSPLRDDPPPLDCRSLVEGENTIAKERLRPLWAGEPRLELSSPSPYRHRENTAPDFRDGKRCYEEIVVILPHNPFRDRCRRTRLESIANDVRIKEIASHRSTSRSGTTSRVRSKSAPTAGDRRSASQISLPLKGRLKTCRATSFRNRTESASWAARRFANSRTSSLSCASPRTSYLARPRSLSRCRWLAIARFCEAFMMAAPYP